MWRLNYTLDLFLNTVSCVELTYLQVMKRNPPLQLGSHIPKGSYVFLLGHFAVHDSLLLSCYLDPECFLSSVLESP